MTVRFESWWTWAAGAAFGAMAGITIAVFGAPALALFVAALGVASVARRTVALASGAFIGVGATWLTLLVRAQLACDAFDAAPSQGCQASGVEPFVVVSAIVLAIGVLLGAAAWRRRTAHGRREEPPTDASVSP
jgi:hypothetical protein